MTDYDYKTIAAPRRAKRYKGVRGPAELFARTIEETINAEATDGWEYYRAEALISEQRSGFLSRRAEVYQSLLIFRRARERVSAPTIRPLDVETPARNIDPPDIKLASNAPEPQRPEPPDLGPPTIGPAKD